ncbi:hypothetical protein [Pseudomonas brassicacearum]|nr:hypothetical protein [Pseudomonas brassicacearum]
MLQAPNQDAPLTSKRLSENGTATVAKNSAAALETLEKNAKAIMHLGI